MKIQLPATTPQNDAEIVSAEVLKSAAPALIQTSEGLSKLEKILEKDFPQETLAGYLKDLCSAEDTRITKMGPIQTPNWSARRDGLDRVLELLRYKKKDQAPTEHAPVKFIFNVVNALPPTPKEPA